ncbi:MAG TPA: alpha/beta fold hydrolase [Mycobacteriales bacterium]|nr:alpha/beta fold hydrolase [Mycobacteriales bacterium]
MPPRLRLAVAGAAALAAPLALPSLAAPAAAQTTNACVTSVPDAGSTTPQKICFSLFKPAGADRRHRVPMVLHSHGWGGSRTTDATNGGVKPFLDAGYGVLSFDQRGFGESGGKARIENPEYEGRDVARLVDLVSRLDWVVQDGKGDPRLGSIGGSYGGGYQFVGAFRQIADAHKQVFDAMAPEITWWDLKQSLAPQGVAKTEWDSALTAAGAKSLPTEVLQGFAESAATGTWSDGSNGTVDLDGFFAKNGPKWQVSQGRRIDVPVLFRQGITDELFPLDQGLKNFAGALTPQARRHSIFVGYNGGHVLPNAFPLTVQPSDDPCSAKLSGGKDFTALTVRFFDTWLKHRADKLSGYGQYHLATAGGTCSTTRAVTPSRTVPVPSLATTELVGPPMAVKVADGPIRVAGSPVLSGTITALGTNNRAFYALGIGTSPADAKIVQGNMLPWASAQPVSGTAVRIDLPSVAVDVPAGQSLFVIAAATNDMYLGFGSRTPGVVLLDEGKVALPLVR